MMDAMEDSLQTLINTSRVLEELTLILHTHTLLRVVFLETAASAKTTLLPQSPAIHLSMERPDCTSNCQASQEDPSQFALMPPHGRHTPVELLLHALTQLTTVFNLLDMLTTAQAMLIGSSETHGELTGE